MQSFTDLKVWQLGMELVKEVYALTKKLPSDERYGITRQLQKASSSILANLAEGFGRFTYPDKSARYVIARGECTEVHAFLLIIVALEFVTAQETQKAVAMTTEIGRMISGLISSCKKRS